MSLTCTKVIAIDGGKDHQGRNKTYHQMCGKAAAEYVLEGSLTHCRAVLCVTHKLMAEREIEQQHKGKPPKEKDPRQASLL